MTTVSIENKVKKYKEKIETLENYVKKWEKEIFTQEISKLSKKCYDFFATLQMNITQLKDEDKKKEYAMLCYKDTHDFLVFIENRVNPDVYVFLSNNVISFAQLIRMYSKYCSKIEATYSIELDTERCLRSGKKLKKK